VSDISFRRHQTATGILIQPVDDAGTLDSTYSAQVGAMVEQCIDESVVTMPGCGMNDQTHWLIDDHEIVVFVKDAERDVLWRCFGRDDRGFDYLNRIPCPDLR